jgi:hypothetical protein
MEDPINKKLSTARGSWRWALIQAIQHQSAASGPSSQGRHHLPLRQASIEHRDGRCRRPAAHPGVLRPARPADPLPVQQPAFPKSEWCAAWHIVGALAARRMLCAARRAARTLGRRRPIPWQPAEPVRLRRGPAPATNRERRSYSYLRSPITLNREPIIAEVMS